MQTHQLGLSLKHREDKAAEEGSSQRSMEVDASCRGFIIWGALETAGAKAFQQRTSFAIQSTAKVFFGNTSEQEYPIITFCFVQRIMLSLHSDHMNARQMVGWDGRLSCAMTAVPLVPSGENVQNAMARALSEDAAAVAIHGATGACLLR